MAGLQKSLPHSNLNAATTSKIEPTPKFRIFDQDCQPAATKSCRFNNSDKDIIQNKLEELLKDGVIKD